jgi:hypothetical protein
MKNDGHLGHLKMFSKMVYIFGWNVLRSTVFQVNFRINHQILIEKISF